MPWSVNTVEESRERLVRLARLPGANISQLCREARISRKTLYKWLRRGDLEDESRRPHNSPLKTVAPSEAMVLQLRDEHPAWGARKIAQVLLVEQQLQLAVTTVHAVLQRHGRISKDASERAKHWQRFEHEAPNRLWQMDFKGHFAVGAQRCHPLTVLDDHSRFNIVLQALDNERTAGVQAVLQQAFERYGLPDRINTDNGPPWGSSGGSVTGLAIWLIRLGVRISYSRPKHPQTNGKEERFHRTMNEEVISRYEFADLVDAQQRFDVWRDVYNCRRPHQALGMLTPASRYERSEREMPATLPPIEYPAGDTVRKVQEGGWLSLRGREFRVSAALRGLPVACRPMPERDNCVQVFLCGQRIDVIEFGE